MRAAATICLAAAMMCGCRNLIPFVGYRGPVVMSGRMDQGLVVVFPGIEGRSSFNESICRGLSDAGVQYAIELYDWTSRGGPIGPLINERAESRNRRKAREIADHVVQYRQAYPNRPVYLVGQSGGGAIAAWVAESLPPGQRVDGIVMLAASLSPDYMIDTALAKSRQGIVSFYSPKDWFLLGMGTTMVGTMDGEHSSSAGRTGFNVPRGSSRPSVYNRLYQIPWTSSMSSAGNTGTHLSSGSELFVAEYVAPFIRAPVWSEDLVTRVERGVQSTARVPTSQSQPAGSRSAAAHPPDWPLPRPSTMVSSSTSSRSR
ncbi:MAG: alpha/beta fold hydrolase [Phycisphaerae bacterium]